MKLNKKILGASIAALGIIGSVAGAFALHTTAASDATFKFGASFVATEGAITYQINGESSGTVTPSYLKADGSNSGKGLGGDYTQAHYQFTLGATYGATMIAQSVVVGNLSIELSNVHSSVVGNAKIYAAIGGYGANTLGKHYYELLSNNVDVDAATKTIANNVAVKADGTQKVDIYVKLTNAITGEALIELNEAKPFDISITWTGETEEFVRPNIVGNATMWKDDAKYAMVPNIHATYDAEHTYEWMFENLPGTMAAAKCKQGATWSDGDNAVLDPAKAYNVFWNGSSSSAASFQVRA